MVLSTTLLKSIDPSLLRYLSSRGMLDSLMMKPNDHERVSVSNKDFNQASFSETLVNGNPFAGIIRFYCIDGYGDGLTSNQVALEPQFPYAVLMQLERDQPHHIFEEGSFSRFHRSEKRYHNVVANILGLFPEKQLPSYQKLSAKQKRALVTYSPAIIYASRHSDVLVYQTSVAQSFDDKVSKPIGDIPIVDLGASNNGYNPGAVRHLFSLLRSCPEETVGFIYHRGLPGLFPLPVKTKPLVICHRWPHLIHNHYHDPRQQLSEESNPYKQYLLVLAQPRITLEAFDIIRTAKGQIEALAKLDIPIERYEQGGTLRMCKELASLALSDDVVDAIQLCFTRHVLQRSREEQGPFSCFDPREVEFRIKFTRDAVKRLAILRAAHTITRETLYFLSRDELAEATKKHILDDAEKNEKVDHESLK
jgi:hypothetical protein